LHDEAAWHRRARRQLQCEPLCAMCLSEGRIIAAKIADHITRIVTTRMRSGLGSCRAYARIAMKAGRSL
jgi:hypothetical protein